MVIICSQETLDEQRISCPPERQDDDELRLVRCTAPSATWPFRGAAGDRTCMRTFSTSVFADSSAPEKSNSTGRCSWPNTIPIFDGFPSDDDDSRFLSRSERQTGCYR